MSQEFYVAPLIQQNARTSSGSYRWSAITVHEGCVWTSLANAISNAAGKAYSPDYVHSKCPKQDEVNPFTPGWHMDDAKLAARRLGFTLENHRADSFPALRAYHDTGYVILLQGDSDQFSNATCSGVFDGDHCIAIHPEEDEHGNPLIYDPICKTFRYESWATLLKYAQKLANRLGGGKLFWGRLIDPVAKVNLFRLYPGARKTVPFPDRTRTADNLVHVHRKPESGMATVIYDITKEGTLFTAYQRIKVDGAWWYGNKPGTRWINGDQLTHEGGST